MPMNFLRLQATQVPVQVLLQQTPSTHKPLLQVSADVHGVPFALDPKAASISPGMEVMLASKAGSPGRWDASL